jgi:hypothetical protein
MIYALDANAFYTYYGREKLNMEPNRKINNNAYCDFLDKQPLKILPTSVFIEIAVYFRKDFDIWVKIRKFIKDKDLIFITTASDRFNEGDFLKLLLVENTKAFYSYIEDICNKKIAGEAEAIYYILNSIMGEYFTFSFRKEHPAVGEQIAARLFIAFDNAVRNIYIEEIKKALLEGYCNGCEKNEAKTKYIDIIADMYKHIYLISKSFDIDRGFNKINEEEIKELFKKVKDQLEVQGLGADKAVKKQLLENQYFAGTQHLEIMKQVLERKNYSDFQAKYMMYTLQAWFNARKRIDKNDVYDLYFLGILDRKPEIKSYLNKNRANQCNVLDDRVIAITFDETVLAFLEVHHSLSYEQIAQFYI